MGKFFERWSYNVWNSPRLRIGIMKRCPDCRRDYYDDSLSYCLDDGSVLLDGPPSLEEPATAIQDETNRFNEAPTKVQMHATDQTAVLPSAIVYSGSRRRIVMVG